MRVPKASRLRFQRAYPLLNQLSYLTRNPRKKKSILRNRDVVNSLCELLFNFLHQTVPLSPEVIEKIRILEEPAIKLVDKKTKLQTKRKILSSDQKGGQLSLLTTLLAVGLPVIVELLKKK